MSTSDTLPTLLAAALDVNARLRALEPGTHANTRPRTANTEATLRTYETETGEALPPGFRDFLLAADGWKACYFGMGLFGLPELRGGGNWAEGQELLRMYEDEEVLENIGIDPANVMPVAAGQRLNLIVIHRSATATPGRVVWIDAGEALGRFEDFRACIERIVAVKRRHLDRVAAQ
ncbi:SMI1/KNR4 family protein [Glycomyces sp. A-F 0318]|uniref:SMI1/KNR4 family protein n=1 Tax=Glycomyces amatae TaxID=2881355 RepID=UPI001E60F6D8|nr:SMI1/KNR4 family protein [Glycomyces amatae]MCD0445886.1 SMI1/KNR4 family protein [Glycomyces amatae]